MSVRHFPQAAFTVMPWKNGGGSTQEICRFPEGAQDWLWRASVADIEQAGPFSEFPGCDRSLTLLTGDGLRLVPPFPEKPVELRPPYGTYRFPGEWPMSGEPIGGPSRDFNFIWKRDALAVMVERRAMHGSLFFLAEPGVSWFVYVLGGEIRIKDDPGSPHVLAGDGLLLQPVPGFWRLILEGVGEALWIKITDRHAAAAETPELMPDPAAGRIGG